MLFENYVNYAGSKTNIFYDGASEMFENYVNYAGSKTYKSYDPKKLGLRTM